MPPVPKVSVFEKLEKSSRGIALLLKNKKALEDQIKAILKASAFGNIYILIPFVKNIDEITKVKKTILKLQKNLKISSDVKIGSMIETPAAALISDEIIKIVDFLSIGTNDLSRYTLATEGASSKKMHPGMIKLLKMVIQSSKDLKKPLFLCGEMIANKKILDELIDLGITNFSVGIKHIDLFH
ncbi:MAG: Phosphoenolpyruvate-protein phosphotransferase [Candidatus Anoxychlamydiales bacterium]|nr:Phosphoenolpyruvate-protein phosphotransferase [Candidatus Anoxychlamydiales bacterium]